MSGLPFKNQITCSPKAHRQPSESAKTPPSGAPMAMPNAKTSELYPCRTPLSFAETISDMMTEIATGSARTHTHRHTCGYSGASNASQRSRGDQDTHARSSGAHSRASSFWSGLDGSEAHSLKMINDRVMVYLRPMMSARRP